METKATVVIVGAGVMGGVYARALTQGPLRFRAELAGICDTDAATATKLAEATGSRAFTDLDSMLEQVRPDVAYVAVPDHLHRDPFLACMRHHVACLVEKPFATTIEDAREMREAAGEAAVRAEVNFSNHWNPVFERAQEAIAGGTIGEVVGVNARLSNALDFPVRQIPWAGRTTSGWFLLSHVFDLTTWLTGGRATEITAEGVRGKKLASLGVDTYDIIQCLVRYDGGWSGVYESAWVLPDSMPSPIDFKFQLVGTEGCIGIDTQDQMVHIAGSSAYAYPGILNWTDRRLSVFLDAVAAGDTSLTSLDDGLENTAMLVALHEALARRVPVALGTSTTKAG